MRCCELHSNKFAMTWAIYSQTNWGEITGEFHTNLFKKIEAHHTYKIYQNLLLEIWLSQFSLPVIFQFSDKQETTGLDQRWYVFFQGIAFNAFPCACSISKTLSIKSMWVLHTNIDKPRVDYIFTLIIFIHLGTFWSQNLPKHYESPSSSILEPGVRRKTEG